MEFLKHAAVVVVELGERGARNCSAQFWRLEFTDKINPVLKKRQPNIGLRCYARQLMTTEMAKQFGHE